MTILQWKKIRLKPFKTKVTTHHLMQVEGQDIITNKSSLKMPPQADSIIIKQTLLYTHQWGRENLWIFKIINSTHRAEKTVLDIETINNNNCSNSHILKTVLKRTVIIYRTANHSIIKELFPQQFKTSTNSNLLIHIHPIITKEKTVNNTWKVQSNNLTWMMKLLKTTITIRDMMETIWEIRVQNLLQIFIIKPISQEAKIKA